MFQIIDHHGSPVTTAAGDNESFETLRQADHIASALTRSTKQLHRAVPVTIDLREPTPVVDLRPVRSSRVLRHHR